MHFVSSFMSICHLSYEHQHHHLIHNLFTWSCQPKQQLNGHKITIGHQHHDRHLIQLFCDRQSHIRGHSLLLLMWCHVVDLIVGWIIHSISLRHRYNAAQIVIEERRQFICDDADVAVGNIYGGGCGGITIEIRSTGVDLAPEFVAIS